MTEKYPDRPMAHAPESWLSIDPACTNPTNSKWSWAVEWRGRKPVAFHRLDGQDPGAIWALYRRTRPKVVVCEGGGYIGQNPKSALKLERVRAYIQGISVLAGVRYYREPKPNQWRPVFKIVTNDATRAKRQQEAQCRLLAKDLIRPMPLAAPDKAKSDDKRCALLLGEASARKWGWA